MPAMPWRLAPDCTRQADSQVCIPLERAFAGKPCFSRQVRAVGSRLGEEGQQRLGNDLLQRLSVVEEHRDAGLATASQPRAILAVPHAVTIRVAAAVVVAPHTSPTITRAIFSPPTDEGSIGLA